jgi:hypothetical protein
VSRGVELLCFANDVTFTSCCVDQLEDKIGALSSCYFPLLYSHTMCAPLPPYLPLPLDLNLVTLFCYLQVTWVCASARS